MGEHYKQSGYFICSIHEAEIAHP